MDLGEYSSSGDVSLSLADLTPPGAFVYSNSVMVLVCTDIAGSLELKSRLGEETAASIIRKHDRLFKKIARSKEGGEIIDDRGDGFIAAFQSASDAVNSALLFQYALAHYKLHGERIHVRIGIHLGDVTSPANDVASSLKIIGSAIDVTARLCDLARNDQILMSEIIFDNARRYVKKHPRVKGSGTLDELRWESHGSFLFKGFDNPVGIFEVGLPEIAPHSKPPNTPKCRSIDSEAEYELAGWRPAANLKIPGRENWILRDKIGEGSFGEVWRADNDTSAEPRAFKFCFDTKRLESLRREQGFINLIRSRLGECKNICRPYEAQFKKYPFYIETEYSNLGNLITWSNCFGGIDSINRDFRIEIIAQVAEALAGAHAAGVLHKDLKPSNILLHEFSDGEVEVRLADFGIGGLMPASEESRRSRTATGIALALPDYVEAKPYDSKSQIYIAPEVLSGEEWTSKSDVYSLGIVFYQVMVGDFRRPIAPGWEREVSDPAIIAEIGAMADLSPEHRPDAGEVVSRLSRLDEIRGELGRAPQSGHKLACDCGYYSDSSARFCAECGSAFVLACVYCGHEVSAGTKFCGGCGRQV